jgi:hypothetical protein
VDTRGAMSTPVPSTAADPVPAPPSVHGEASRTALAALLSVLALGCAASGPPAAEAALVGPLTVTTACWTGGVLSGPRALAEAQVASADAGGDPDGRSDEVEPAAEGPAPGPARRVRITVDALSQKLPGGSPLVRRAALVANVSGAIALSVDNPLLLGGRVATGGDAVVWQRAAAGLGGSSTEGATPPRVERMHTHEEVVLPDETFVLTLGAIDVERVAGDTEGVFSAYGPFPQRVDVLVGATAERLEVGVAVQTRDTRGAAAEAGPLRRTEHGAEVAVRPLDLRRDVALLLDGPLAGGTPVALQLPSPLDAGAATSLLVFIEGLDEPPNDAEVETARARLAAADALHAAVADAPNEQRIAEANALVSIASGEGRRTALLVLADTRGATLAADLALTLEETALADFAARLAAARVAPGEDIGWQLEREALHHAAAALATDGAQLALEAVLVRRAGHAGRFAAVLEEVAASASLADADAWLVHENLVYLEDSDPAARVRAHNWLVQRGAAPVGYEPFAAPETRRAVLRAARAGGEQ